MSLFSTSTRTAESSIFPSIDLPNACTQAVMTGGVRMLHLLTACRQLLSSNLVELLTSQKDRARKPKNGVAPVWKYSPKVILAAIERHCSLACQHSILFARICSTGLPSHLPFSTSQKHILAKSRVSSKYRSCVSCAKRKYSGGKCLQSIPQAIYHVWKLPTT